MESKAEKEGDTNNLVFAVNGERFELSSVDPSTTLLEFLRTSTRFKSVKLGCGEGGCGACVVLLSKYDPLLDRVEDFTVSSCLTLLCSINRCSVTTSEGIGNSKDGFHPIHERMAGFHASQCGFCTPGMCVSFFAALVNADKSDRPKPPDGFSKLTVSEAEKSIAGNICRCTGYRPIADACKSFAFDVDIEDLGFNSFWRKGENKETKLSRLPLFDRRKQVCTYPEFLKKDLEAAMVLDPRKYHWETPASISELQSVLEVNTGNNSEASMKLVVGNTGSGYYKELEPYARYVDIRHIPELLEIKKDHHGIQIGAAVTISKAIGALKEESVVQNCSQVSLVFQKLASHMEKIANEFVRNSGSVGGNLVMAQSKQFPSDLATILLAVNATVNIMKGRKYKKLVLEDFLDCPPLEFGSVLLSVKIPFWNNPFQTGTNLLFETYRAAPRPLGSALPYLNAAFLVQVSLCEDSNKTIVKNCRLAFGSYGAKHTMRVKKVEELLTGKSLTYTTIYEAIIELKATIVPEDGTSSSAYRSSLAVGYLFEFFRPLVSSKIPNCVPNGQNGYSLFKDFETIQNSDKLDQVKSRTLVSSAQQVLESTAYAPVGEAVIKTGAAIQASGEAVFVDDIPSPADCLHSAFIYSTKPLAWVKGIRFRNDVVPPGVLAVISFKDIPERGQNIGAKTIFGPEPLFADELTRCVGQRVALVVADTQRNADKAVAYAIVDYDTENLEAPILSVEAAVERSSLFEVPPMLYPAQVGDASKGMAEADCKILSSEIRLPSQYYFYMETHTALALPDEDHCMTVYSSSQNPEYMHATIGRCLGVPEHNVRVITRRVGGGFGGKAIKSMPVATACALAAYKLQRPVRIYMNRKTDMLMAGGRHPMKITYNVGFKPNGKITALQLEILIDAGMAPDVSPMIPHNILSTLRKYNWGALSFDMKVCKTNLPSRTAMRAPGEVQGSYIAEAVIEHVASSLSIDVDTVRRANLHTYDSVCQFYKNSAGEPHEYTLPLIWDKLAQSSNFDQRVGMVREFNSSNKWVKRGISRVPIVYLVLQRPTPGKVSILSDGSVSVEVGGNEIGQGLHTKVKQMAAYGLGLIRCDGSENLLEKVRVQQSDTLSLIQGGFTAGSSTSESSCEAVRLCCSVLVERLTLLKNALNEEMGSVDWETLISQAHARSVNMSASTLFCPDVSSMSYVTFGAAVSEVEVDLLTGETRILRSDIIYDCGQTLNPAVDLGQVEGAFVQGIGFFMLEEYSTNSDGLILQDGTWNYKVPTLDNIPKEFNVEILNSGPHKKRILSSKASGEPPLLLAASVHCATRSAIVEAREQLRSWGCGEGLDSYLRLPVPAVMPVVKELCGLDSVERYLEWKIRTKQSS